MARNANQVHKERLTVLDRIGIKITRGVGTMYCAIVFTIIALISLPSAIASDNPVVIVGWISGQFIQLVLLAIILFGQAKDAQHSEIRAEIEFETVMREEKENREILLRLEELDNKLIKLQGKPSKTS